MRHSTFTLTTDSYGHLFPGQEAEAVGHLDSFTGSPLLRRAATGTEQPDSEACSAKRSNCSANWCVDRAPKCENEAESNSGGGEE
jgi:hypothetical protein